MGSFLTRYPHTREKINCKKCNQFLICYGLHINLIKASEKSPSIFVERPFSMLDCSSMSELATAGWVKPPIVRLVCSITKLASPDTMKEYQSDGSTRLPSIRVSFLGPKGSLSSKKQSDTRPKLQFVHLTILNLLVQLIVKCIAKKTTTITAALT